MTIVDAFIALLVVLFAPTLAVGLTRYPRALGAARIVWRVLNAFAVATHIDSPGTFKPPGPMSPAPPTTDGDTQ